MLALSPAVSEAKKRQAAPTKKMMIGSADVPMDISSGRPVIMAQIGDGPPVEVEFDTGSQGAFIPKAMADKLKLPVIGEARLGSPFGGEPKIAKLVSLGKLKIGGAAATMVDATVEDDIGFRGANARLVIGPAMFANHVVTFDYAARRIKLSPMAPENIKSWVPADPNGLLESTVELGNKSYILHIDSGAPGALTLPRSSLDSLAVKPELRPYARMRTIDKEFTVDIGTLNADAVVAGVPVKLVGTLFADVPFANLGSQGLSEFTVVIDNPGKRWALVAPAGKTPLLAAMAMPPRPRQKI